MKTKTIVITVLFIISGYIQSMAQSQVREVPAFTEISFRIAGTIHLKQGKKQKVEIEASSETLEQIITEVNGRALIFRFPTRSFFNRNFNPGKIDIYITAPEINGLNIAGSGDILAEGVWETRIMDLSVSGSGSLIIDELNAERVKAAVTGSGDIVIKGGAKADDFTGNISGSGNIRANEFEAEMVSFRIAGSGNGYILTNGSLNARIAGSGNVYYSGNPNIDSSVAGSGKVIERD